MAKMKPFHIVRWLPISIFLGYITIVFFKSASPVADDDARSPVQRAQEWIKSPLQAVVAERPEPSTVTVTTTECGTAPPRTADNNGKPQENNDNNAAHVQALSLLHSPDTHTSVVTTGVTPLPAAFDGSPIAL